MMERLASALGVNVVEFLRPTRKLKRLAKGASLPPPQKKTGRVLAIKNFPLEKSLTKPLGAMCG